MSTPTLADFSQKIRGIEFVMLFTHGDGDKITGRPMSNNSPEYDGNSYFFALDTTNVVKDLTANPAATLSVAGDRSPEGRPGIFATIEGKAELIRDTSQFDAYWHGGIGRFFPQGTGTPGLVLIKVRAQHIHFWDAGKEGEITL